MNGFRDALLAVPFLERDAWLDAQLGLGEIPADGSELPRDGVPYLPAPVDALLHTAAFLGPQDVLVDVGSGLGRPAIALHLLSGAKAIGLEVQPALVKLARQTAQRLGVTGVSFVEGDALDQGDALAAGTVFFLYCPFSGERLTRLLTQLEAVARSRPIHVCCVDLELPTCAWLEKLPAPSVELDVYRSR